MKTSSRFIAIFYLAFSISAFSGCTYTYIVPSRGIRIDSVRVSSSQGDTYTTITEYDQEGRVTNFLGSSFEYYHNYFKKGDAQNYTNYYFDNSGRIITTLEHDDQWPPDQYIETMTHYTYANNRIISSSADVAVNWYIDTTWQEHTHYYYDNAGNILADTTFDSGTGQALKIHIYTYYNDLADNGFQNYMYWHPVFQYSNLCASMTETHPAFFNYQEGHSEYQYTYALDDAGRVINKHSEITNYMDNIPYTNSADYYYNWAPFDDTYIEYRP